MWFSSSCGGIFELRREIQASSLLSQGSPFFHSSCEGEQEIALESLQGKWHLIYACVQDLIFISRGDTNLRVAFQTHLRSQAWYRGVADDSSLLSSPDGYLLEPTEWPKGSQASCGVWKEASRLLSRPCRKRRPSSRHNRGISWVFSSCGTSVVFLTR